MIEAARSTLEWLAAPPRRYRRGETAPVRRGLRLPPPSVHTVRADDGVELRLTRYQGGSRGPVVLSHCVGVSSRMYLVEAQQTTLTEYLVEQGFDVWLLDHRLSIELRASQFSSTMDDVARRDYPAAVAAIREVAGAPSVQVVAHGIGSSTFTMAMLAGLQGVRAAVCSQVSTHIDVPVLNDVKVRARMAETLSAFGARTFDVYTDGESGWPSRILDRATRLYPIAVEERCLNPVCHRISMLYGELYEHDRLGEGVHDSLHELFGIANLALLSQLGKMTRAGHVVDEHGRDAYLPHLDRLNLPIAFLHGSDNQCVLPRSTRVTYDLLSQRFGAQQYARHEIEGYGHVDCMIGEHADRDVFPLVLEHLARSA
ncbi:MAG: hypothetical protein WD734_03345 [Dehalococcoidia bacterium]